MMMMMMMMMMMTVMSYNRNKDSESRSHAFDAAAVAGLHAVDGTAGGLFSFNADIRLLRAGGTSLPLPVLGSV